MPAVCTYHQLWVLRICCKAHLWHLENKECWRCTSVPRRHHRGATGSTFCSHLGRGEAEMSRGGWSEGRTRLRRWNGDGGSPCHCILGYLPGWETDKASCIHSIVVTDLWGPFAAGCIVASHICLGSLRIQRLPFFQTVHLGAKAPQDWTVPT